MSAVGAAMILNELRDAITVASVASDGAGARAGAIYVNRDVRIKSAVYVPTGGNNATKGTATTSASYRRLTLVNGGTAGTGTTVLASLNNTASLGSFGTSGFTLAGTAVASVSAASGEVIVLSHATVGTDQADATSLAAGVVWVTYETI